MIWVDFIVIAIVVWGIIHGFWRGFLAQIVQFAALVAAFLLTLWIFPPLGDWLSRHLHFPVTVARPLSLVVVFFVLVVALQFVANILYKLFAPFLAANPLNRLFGAVIGAVQKVLIMAFLLLILVTLPISPSIKNAIDNSRIGKPLIHLALQIENTLERWFKLDTLKSLGYQIVGTDEKNTTALNYTVTNPTVDLESEAKLLALTNAVRDQNKKGILVPNIQLRAVAEAHGRDMLAKGYFSHISPQGKDVVARLSDANVTVLSVGENLASASSVETAQLGLMASKGHRDNILNGDFNQVGVSVLDAGKHGKMIVEVFAKVY